MATTSSVRVRFPPSPTGEPHLGNMRTAIFNWLVARGSGGAFIIRIEDTDQARSVEGAAERTMEALRWLGVDWDEGPDIGGEYGPYVQSERLDRYHAAAEKLIELGKAYRCYCSPERLAKLRSEQPKDEPSGYDRRCRKAEERERAQRESDGATLAVRFAMPVEGETGVEDLIRGDVTFENRLIDDFVILRANGFPTYHLASVVDDHEMEISHVLRAEDWLPSAPRHVRTYEALGWNPPEFAHLPMILGADRSKLSKRHGATSVLEYREMGYVPEAMVNLLALLGWSLDDKTEVFSTEELVERFSLERVSKAGAVFNVDKLSWLNGHYIRQMSREQLTDVLLDYWRIYPPDEIPDLPDRAHMLRIVPMIHDRLKTLRDAAPLLPFFFRDAEYDPQELVQKGMDTDVTRRALEEALSRMESVQAFDAESLDALLRPLADELGLKVRQLFGTLRIALTGLQVSPPLFESMEVLGRDRTLAAIRTAIETLEQRSEAATVP